jgi:hypothetical protein
LIGIARTGTFRNYRTGNLEDCYYWDMTGDVGLEALFDKKREKNKYGRVF